jgi:glucose/arabinose dehydrogenase
MLAGCGAGTTAAAHRATLAVVVGGLDNPRQMSFGPDGALYVAEAGSGGRARCAKDPSTGTQICVGASGAIARVARGVLSRVVSGLPSVAGASGQESSGPADAIVSHGRLVFVTQDTQISSTGANQFARPGRLLGQLLTTGPTGGVRLLANLARFEATHNPDHGLGASSAADAIDSDPYGLVSYRGGYAVADAAGNDLLWVSSTGAIRVLAVFGVQYELAPAGVVAKTARRVAAQSVPTAVAVGPDGALYVSELSGFPFDPGYAHIWRVVPGQRPTVYARGFTNISAIAFDREGRLLVLEINRAGLRDTRAPGELIRIGRDGRRSVLASAGLSWPTGIGVARDGAIFIANNGTSTASGSGVHGEIVRVLTH